MLYKKTKQRVGPPGVDLSKHKLPGKKKILSLYKGVKAADDLALYFFLYGKWIVLGLVVMIQNQGF